MTSIFHLLCVYLIVFALIGLLIHADHRQLLVEQNVSRVEVKCVEISTVNSITAGFLSGIERKLSFPYETMQFSPI